MKDKQVRHKRGKVFIVGVSISPSAPPHLDTQRLGQGINFLLDAGHNYSHHGSGITGLRPRVMERIVMLTY